MVNNYYQIPRVGGFQSERMSNESSQRVWKRLSPPQMHNCALLEVQAIPHYGAAFGQGTLWTGGCISTAFHRLAP